MDGVIVREAAARGITPEELRQGYADCASLRRFVTAEDVADMAVFLASPQARSITGMTMSVDGHTEKVTL
jgi:enoyl-[acyl-carrier-protein] reductase (NADH)